MGELIAPVRGEAEAGQNFAQLGQGLVRCVQMGLELEFPKRHALLTLGRPDRIETEFSYRRSFTGLGTVEQIAPAGGVEV